MEIKPSEAGSFKLPEESVGTGRSKRQAPSAGSGPLSYFTRLNDSHSSLLVSWAGGASDAIVVLAKSVANQWPNLPATLYVSYDYGVSYTNVSQQLMLSSPNFAISDLYHASAPQESERYIFTDLVHRKMLVTRDLRSYSTVNCGFAASIVAMHPTSSDLVLAMDGAGSLGSLYLSTDFGSLWVQKAGNVKAFVWAESWDNDPMSFYVEVDRGTGLGFVQKFRRVSNSGYMGSIVVDNVVDFTLKDNYIFTTTRLQVPTPAPTVSPTQPAGLELWVAYQNSPLQKARFPASWTHLDYFLVDSSEDEVLICVNHGRLYTNLYISNNNGTDFSLSLARVVYINPSSQDSDYLTRQLYRGASAFADVYRVEGLDGIYIASQFLTNASAWSSALSLNQTTLITFDKGGRWQRIRAPYRGSQGGYTNCYWNMGCSLHLTQQFHSYLPQRYPTIYSTENAVGIILATGIYGSSVRAIASSPAVFLSTDAGFTWREVLNGSYSFAMGDHGGIIVAVKHLEETSSVIYSVNEGLSWQSMSFMNQDKMVVYGLLTEPGSRTGVFSLWGSLPGPHQWVISQLNLTKLFDRWCSSGDYKMWSPGSGSSGGGPTCLLGQTVQYQRRQSYSVCYNGEEYERLVVASPCPCGRDNYECDFGYEPAESVAMTTSSWTQSPFGFGPDSSTAAVCVRDSDVPDSAVNQMPTYCPIGATYRVSQGYRKVPDDHCQGGNTAAYEPLMVPCPIAVRPEFIIYSTRTSIHRYLLAEARDETLPVGDLQEVISVEFDYSTNTLFWADRYDDKIEKLVLDGHHQPELVVSGGLGKIESMTLDWESDNIYWVEVTSPAIEVAAQDGRWRRALITNSTYCVVPVTSPVRPGSRVLCLDKPRSLVVHPRSGVMFWTDWSADLARIARSNMDGTNVTFIVSNPSWVHWPNGIAIDYAASQLYVADGFLHTIFKCDFNGLGLTQVVSGSLVVNHPFSLGVFNDKIFWNDWGDWQLKAIDRATGRGMRTLVRFPMLSGSRPMALKVMNWTAQQDTGVCDRSRNGGCIHLCIPVPGYVGKSCICADGYSQTKNGNAGESCGCFSGQVLGTDGYCRARNNTCYSYQFACSNGRCIPASYRCDRDNDCGDFSDEQNCYYSTCLDYQFKCRSSGQCISSSLRCNRNNDCGDNSDEEVCAYCTSTQFTCANNRCISRLYVCDGDNDCADYSDELNCTRSPYTTPPPVTTPRPCLPSSEFSCLRPGIGRSCIPRSWICDGDRDCADGSDEVGCNVTCRYNQFRCWGGSPRCVAQYAVCNGYYDCSDGSDELACNVTTPRPSTTPYWPGGTTPSTSCPFWMWLAGSAYRCNDGSCVFVSRRCDGVPQCRDGSDEWNCPITVASTTTPPWWLRTTPPSCDTRFNFRCFDGTCIVQAYLCNGYRDCLQGEDEDGSRCGTGAPGVFCPDSYFRCFATRACVAPSLVCNGRADCADGSDETNCGLGGLGTTAAPTKCLDSEFSCDAQQTCLDQSLVCDDHVNCLDYSDEDVNYCRRMRGFVVVNLRVAMVRSTWALIMWQPPYSSANAQGLMYEPLLGPWKAGTNSSGLRSLARLSALAYNLTDLRPSTAYMVSVRVVSNSVVYNQGRPSIVLTTAAAAPGKVASIHVRAAYPGSWSVYVQYTLADLSSGYHLVQLFYRCIEGITNASANSPSWTYGYCSRMSSGMESYNRTWQTCQMLLTTYFGAFNAGTYQFKLSLYNNFGTGPESDIATAEIGRPSSLPSVSSVWYTDRSPSSISLAWNVSGTAASGYTVEYRDTNDRIVRTNVTDTSATITGLSPGREYGFVVTAFQGSGYGEPSSVFYVTTSGDPLPKVYNLVASVSQTSASVNVSWQLLSSISSYKQDFTFRVAVDPDAAVLRQGGPAYKQVDVSGRYWSTNFKVTLDGLEYCELYYAVVYILLPYEGPRSAESSFATPTATRAPPKHVTVTPVNSNGCINGQRTYTVAWERSCPSDTGPTSYSVSLKSSTAAVKPAAVLFTGLQALVQLLPGANTYNVSVIRTDVNAESQPVVFTTEACPAPFDLFCELTQPDSVYAQASEDEAYSATIYWTYDASSCCETQPKFDVLMADDFNFSSYFPVATGVSSVPSFGSYGSSNSYSQYFSGRHTVPLTLALLHYGRSVAFKVRSSRPLAAAGLGGMSDIVVCDFPSATGSIMADSTVGMNKGLIIGSAVAGFVCLVLVLSFIVWCVRRRRLRATLDSFASSHYDTRTGTATFSAPDSLTDDDTPLIGGFSDDEPLVVA